MEQGNAAGAQDGRLGMGDVSGDAKDAFDAHAGKRGRRETCGRSNGPYPRCESKRVYAITRGKPSGDCESVGEAFGGTIVFIQCSGWELVLEVIGSKGKRE